MKKTLVIMMATVAVAASSFGQGSLQFVTGSNTVRKETAVGNTALVNVGTGAANGLFELLWAPQGTTDLNLFNAVPGTLISPSPTAGRLSGGVRTIPAGAGFAGVAPGAVVSVVIRGWTGGAASYAATETGYNQGLVARGYSPIFTVDTGDPTTTPAGTAGTLPGGAGITLTYVVPEPTSMALAGLGAASLLIFRRRK